jgi:MerR family transcriptional regulator, heat shock protein HspR
MGRIKQDSERPLYLISVVSQMLEIHPQTLRLYEREGFVKPTRVNRQRVYSDRDLERLNLVIELTRDLGVNRAGVDIILRMRSQLEGMQRQLYEIMALLDEKTRREFETKLRKLFDEV